MKTTELKEILNNYQKTLNYFTDVYFQLKVQDHNYKARTMLLFHSFNVIDLCNCNTNQKNNIIRAIDSIFVANEYKKAN